MLKQIMKSGRTLIAPLVLLAPEGTPLFIFQEDFLGEAIEVDEDVDPAEIEEFQ